MFVHRDQLRTFKQAKIREIDQTFSCSIPFLSISMFLLALLILVLTPTVTVFLPSDIETQQIMNTSLCIAISLITIAAILWGFFAYHLIKIRNSHFVREEKFRLKLISILENVSKDRKIDLSPLLDQMKLLTKELEVKNRNKLIWAVISALTGIAMFFLYHTLMSDMKDHEAHEFLFKDLLDGCLSRLGVRSLSFIRKDPIETSNFLIFFILVLITFGLFSYYWTFAILRDLKSHILWHHRWEKIFLENLRRISPDIYTEDLSKNLGGV